MSTTRDIHTAFTATHASDDKRTPLEKHIEYFGGAKTGSKITLNSMADRNKSLGDSTLAAKATATKVAIGAGAIIKHCPFKKFKPKDAVGKLNHSDHTGIFNRDGTINEEVWTELCGYSSRDDRGTQILTQSRFNDFLQSRRQQDIKNSSWFGKKASDGEWDSYWKKFGSTSKSGGIGVYVTLQQFREFFEDSSKPGHEVEQRVKSQR